MKINIWVNDYYNKYNQVSRNDYNHIDVNVFKKIVEESNDALIVLRGEISIHPFSWQLLNSLQNKTFIVSTDSSNPDNLILYKKDIPYLSFRNDGYLNDQIRVNSSLTYNMHKLFHEFSGRETKLRIEHTISPYNLDYLDVDILILRKLINRYSRMKEPYFVIYQQSEIYGQTSFMWTPLSKSKIDEMNRQGILTKKNLAFLNGWLNKQDYSCVSPRQELVFDYQGKSRLCQSSRFHEIIGDIHQESLKEIFEKTQSLRENVSDCPMRKNCWLAYHYKDNIYGQT